MRTVSASRETQVHVGRNISLLLRYDRLTIKGLGGLLGMDPSLVSRRLSGDIGMEIEELARVAEALQVRDVCAFFLSPGEFLERARPSVNADNASLMSSPPDQRLFDPDPPPQTSLLAEVTAA